MTRPTNFAQPSGADSVTGKCASTLAATGARVWVFRRPPLSAATSRAIPRTLIASPRFGVTLICRTWSSRVSTSRKLRPRGVAPGKFENAFRLIAEAELARAAQHPVRFHVAKSCGPDRHVTGKLRPDECHRGSQPGARITRTTDDLERFLPSVVTLHTDSLSACGWRAHSTISPTTTPENGGRGTRASFHLETRHRETRRRVSPSPTTDWPIRATRLR